MRKLLLAGLAHMLMMGGLADAAEIYEIQAAVNDETIVINNEVFKARTYCLGWGEGDKVLFLAGSAFGACATAELFNLDRKSKCAVWCE